MLLSLNEYQGLPALQRTTPCFFQRNQAYGLYQTTRQELLILKWKPLVGSRCLTLRDAPSQHDYPPTYAYSQPHEDPTMPFPVRAALVGQLWRCVYVPM